MNANDVLAWVKNEVASVLGIARDLRRQIRIKEEHWGRVLAHAKYQSNPERDFGVGAVQIEVPSLLIQESMKVYARPRHLIQGRFRIPPIGSYVRVCNLQGVEETTFEYYGGYIWDDATVNRTDNKERMGFKSKVPGDKVGGGLLVEARMRPESLEIIESSDQYAFGYDRDAKELFLSVLDSSKVRIETANDGTIFLGNRDPVAGGPIGKTYIKMNPGTTGEVSVEYTTKEKFVITKNTVTGYDSSEKRFQFDYSKDRALFFFKEIFFGKSKLVKIVDGDVISGTGVSLETSVPPTCVPGPSTPLAPIKPPPSKPT